MNQKLRDRMEQTRWFDDVLTLKQSELTNYTGCGTYAVAVNADGEVAQLMKLEMSKKDLRTFKLENQGLELYTAEGSCTQLMEWRELV